MKADRKEVFEEVEADLDKYIKKGYYTKDFLLYDIAVSLRTISEELKMQNDLLIEGDLKDGVLLKN